MHHDNAAATATAAAAAAAAAAAPGLPESLVRLSLEVSDDRVA